jgi:hypothetical protein
MPEFVFRKHDNVGTAAAEDDGEFLDECFVDRGEIQLLLDCRNAKRIIVGRTGTGKSALIQRLSGLDINTVKLSPHSLALNFIATNKVFAFFEAAGVNLSPFYILLWKHLLVVELLKRRFNITNEISHKSFMTHVRTFYQKKDRYKEQAIDYLENWGAKFWLTTEERVHELTNRVESSLTAAAKGNFGGIDLSINGARKLSKEQRQEIVEHGLDAVSKIQIRELDNILAVLDENIFADSKNPYYVTIDMLDEDWADDRIKFKLIRSLIDAVRQFKAICNVKIIVALRQDLLDRVIRSEVTPGFQEEKHKALYLTLQWNKNDLIKIVENRLNKLIRHRYTKETVSFPDIFPDSINGKTALDYLLDRTFLRPRDMIIFLNECLELCEGRPNISAAIIKIAEERYSAERLQSLAHEWITIYPNLYQNSRIFYGFSDRFDVSDITEDVLLEHINEIASEIKDPHLDPITRSLDSLYATDGNFGSVRSFILREFYVTGLIGIKTGPTDSISWSLNSGSQAKLNPGAVRPSSTICIHPMFHRALGIKYKQTQYKR